MKSAISSYVIKLESFANQTHITAHHIPTGKRLAFNSLEELIDYLKSPPQVNSPNDKCNA